MKVLIVDQFQGPTPFAIQHNPVPFEELVKQVMAQDAARNERSLKSCGLPAMHRAQVRDIDEGFKLPPCSTAIRANADGIAEVWLMKWDSSG